MRERPYLYFSQAEWDRMRHRINSPLGDLVLQQAEVLASLEPPSYALEGPPGEVPPDYDWQEAAAGTSWIGFAQRLRNQTETLAFAYCLTGDGKYAEAGKRLGLSLMRWKRWAYSPIVQSVISRSIEVGAIGREDVWPPDYDRWHSDLVTAYVSRCGAVVYDWLYDKLTPEERTECRSALWEKGICPTVKDARNGVWWSRMLGSNYPLTLLSCAGIAALAIAPECGDAESVISFTEHVVRELLDSVGQEGGWQEGMTYWESIQNPILYDLSRASYWQRPLALHPFYRRTGLFPLYFSNPHLHGPRVAAEFSDSSGTKEFPAEEYWLARATRNPYVQWLADTLCTRAFESPEKLPKAIGDPMQAVWRTFAFYDPMLQGKRPRPWRDLPPSKLFGDINWAVLRESWEADAACMPFKSGKLGHFHRQLDVNSFELWVNREKVIVELGSGPYDMYYFSRLGPEKVAYVNTIGHNTLFVNGTGQRTGTEYLDFDNVKSQYYGTISYFFASKEYDYLIGDGSKAYGACVERFGRHVIYLRPDVFLLIDDVALAEDALPEIRFHAARDIDLTDDGFVARATSAAAVAQLIAPEPFTAAVNRVQGVAEEKAYPFVTVAPKASCRSCSFVTLMHAGKLDAAPVRCETTTHKGTQCFRIIAGQRKWTIRFTPSSELTPAEVAWEMV